MALNSGDITFVGINTNGSDWFAFAALNNIAAGSVIYFTDNELTSSSATSFNSGESYMKWVAPAGGVEAGTIVQISVPGNQSSVLGSSTGTASWVSSSGNTGAGLSTTLESLYAYTADSDATVNTPISHLAFIGTGNAADAIPAGLPADFAIAFTDGSDSAYYSGTHSGYPNISDYAALIANTANWTKGAGETNYSSVNANALVATPLGTLSVDSQSISEGNSDTKTLTFTITLSTASSQTVTVDYATADATATVADNDYAAATGTLSFAPGETTKTVAVTLNGDSTYEANESFTLHLSNPANALIGTADGTATLTNDDLDVVYGSGYVDIGGIRVYNEADNSLHGSTTTPVATDDVVLVRLGSIQGSSAGAESVAFENGKIYSTNINGNTINVHAVAADGSLSNLDPVILSGLPNYKTGGVNSVAVKNGIIAVAFEHATAGSNGHIAFFNATDNSLINTITVGVLPDQLTFTADGSKLLVANEAEAISSSNNPVGSVSIIDLSGGAANAVVSNTISFDALNGAESLLKTQGLALYGNQSAAADIEPEYISVSADGTRAYVTLQEVNAIAVIDLSNPAADRPLAILPLGAVDHNLGGNEFDASDKDGTGGTAAINLQNYNVLGLLQPDALATFSVAGTSYFVTANEGDSRVGSGIADSMRLGDAGYVLDPTAYPNAAALKASAKLGRLNVLTNVGDTDGDGDYDQIYTLGGRGITIFRQEANGTITKVRETGGEFEVITSLLGAGFNSNQSTAPNSFDTRSDDKGPEPEGVAIGEINGRTYAFVGLERVGGFMIYDVTDPANAYFVGYKPETAADLGPEVQKFISAVDSPTGQALLISGNEISNTVTLYSIQTQSEGNDTITGGMDAESWNGRGGNDLIRANGGNDTIDGGAGNDSLEGGDGNDILNGGVDKDTLAGGLGDDTYYVDSNSDIIQELAGNGSDTIISTVNYKLNNQSVENLTLEGAALNGTGNSLGNRLVGNGGTNSLNGGIGSDTMIGGLGNDIYYTDNSDDVVSEMANEGADRVYSAINYTLGSNLEHLTLQGTADLNGTGNELNNNLAGNAGHNILDGAAGNDTLNGGIGADTLIGGLGNDIYWVDNNGDTVSELAREGADRVYSAISYTLGSNLEYLTLQGAADLNGTGNELNNNLAGNAGHNRLDGAAGNDTLNGGAGDDTYMTARGGGADIVSDHDATTGNMDVLKFGPGVSHDQLWFKQAGNNLVISIIGTTDKVTINNWYVETANHIEQIQTADGGKTLTDSDVQALVTAMASMTAPALGQTTLTAQQHSQLDSVIAASWS